MEIVTKNEGYEGFRFGFDVQVKEGKLLMRYKDETWGSFRHWQIVDSLRKVRNIEEAEKLIEARERNGFKACWEFECLEKDYADSSRNRHREATFIADVREGVWLLKRWVRYHPSGNHSKYLSGFIYAIIKNGEIVKVVDKRERGW